MNKREKMWAWFRLGLLLIMVMATGAICGVAYDRWQIAKNREPIVMGDFSEKISLLHFDSIENGVLKGSLEGIESRIIVKNAPEVHSLFPGEFEFSITEILPLLKTIPAPDGMAYVASKNGKYFYPLDSPRAAMMSVKNRIFFRDEDHANQMGFARKK